MPRQGFLSPLPSGLGNPGQPHTSPLHPNTQPHETTPRSLDVLRLSHHQAIAQVHLSTFPLLCPGNSHMFFEAQKRPLPTARRNPCHLPVSPTTPPTTYITAPVTLPGHYAVMPVPVCTGSLVKAPQESSAVDNEDDDDGSKD